MDKLISVIVPIYKVENYLSECIESLLNQTYKNLEIILVDDGSPDRCGEICEEYKTKDERIVVIHKENGGLSDARNAGMKVMTGDYIVFVDSDDYMTPEGIEFLAHLLEEREADMVIGGVRRVSEKNEEINIEGDPSLPPVEMDKEGALIDFFKNGCSSWGRIFKKKLHEGIEFPKGEINEDEAIMVKIIERCEKVVRSAIPVYNYRFRDESITTTTFHKKKLVWEKHCRENYEYVKDKYPKVKPYARKRYAGSLVWLTVEMLREESGYDEEIRDYINALKKHLCFYVMRKDVKTASKVRALIMCISKSLYKKIFR